MGLTARLQGARVLWLAVIAAVCAVTGGLAGVDPRLGVATGLGLAFTACVVVDITAGLVLFTVLSFLDVINIGGAAVSFMKVAGLLLFVSWVARTATSPRRDATTLLAGYPGLVAACVVLVAWSALSFTWAESHGNAVTTTNRFLLDALLFAIVLAAVRRREHLRWVLGGFIIGADLSAIYGLINPVAPTGNEVSRLVGALGESNQQATVLVAAIVLAVGLIAVSRGSPVVRLALAVGIVVAFAGLFGTLSRAGLISLGCVLIAGVIVGGRWRVWAVLLLIACAGATVTYFAAIASTGAVQRVTSPDTSGRSDIWTVGWRMFQANPVTGVGAGNFQVSSIHYLQQPGTIHRADLIVVTPKVAHNIYLELLADLGVPGLIALLSVFGTAIGCAVRAARASQRAGDRDLELLSRCLILALVAFLSADFFASEVYAKQLWLLLALCPAVLAISRSGQLAQ